MPGLIEVALEDAGYVEEINEDVTLVGDPACESELVLAVLEENSTLDDYTNMVLEHATEMELYGLIADADMAMEATKNIVRLNKTAKFTSIQRRACIRLAKKANDSLYTKYDKYRTLWREVRDKIYTKYMSKATRDAKIIMQNARRRASGMPVETGRSITDKMDKEIERIKNEK